VSCSYDCSNVRNSSNCSNSSTGATAPVQLLLCCRTYSSVSSSSTAVAVAAVHDVVTTTSSAVYVRGLSLCYTTAAAVAAVVYNGGHIQCTAVIWPTRLQRLELQAITQHSRLYRFQQQQQQQQQCVFLSSLVAVSTALHTQLQQLLQKHALDGHMNCHGGYCSSYTQSMR
jgi:hypothetical protein